MMLKFTPLLCLLAVAMAELQWVPFNGYLYFHNHGKLNWYAANDFCTKNDADLTSINNAAEQEFVASLVKAKNEWAWLGGFRVTPFNKFIWTDGSAFAYTNWKSDKYPLENTKFNCLDITHNDNDHSGAPLNNTWTNYDCAQLASSICKKR